MSVTQVDGSYIEDNAIDSDHYLDGSIDNAHLADDAVDSDELAAGAVDLAHMSSQSVDEDNLYISNAGNDGEFLSKQSGNNGGLTWAAAGSSDISVQVYNDADQGIPNNQTTILTFNQETFKTVAGMHSTSTNPSRLIATTAGKYLVVGKIEWADSTVGNRWLTITNQDGGATQAVVSTPTTSSTSVTMGQVATALVNMSVDDYVELRARHNHGSTLNANNPRTSFSMIKIMG